jgi:L-asparaginase II
VGASGVYCAGIVGEGIGVALKVEDGHARAAEVALLFILDTLLQPTPSSLLPDMAEPVIRNTRGDEVGLLRGTGSITQWSGTA